MNGRIKNNYKKNMLVMGLVWLAGLISEGNFAYAQTEYEVSDPVEILIADPERVGSSVAFAFFEQAKKYHDGDGIAQDFLKARDLYLRAAQMGNNDAKVNLGYLYFMGEGVGQDYEKARNWYLSAATNGSKDAQLNLAMIYQNGFGVPKDKNKAQYWRTYEQVKSINKKPATKPVVTVSKKPIITKPEAPKSVDRQVKTSQPSVNDAKPLMTTKPQTIRSQTNENKPKTEARPEIAEDQVMTIALAPQAKEVNLGMGDVNSAGTKELVVSVPQSQILPIQEKAGQAKDGSVRISETIAALNKEVVLPAPVRTLRNRPLFSDKRPLILSQWISNIIAVLMLALVIVTSIWFVVQYSKIGKQKKAHVFAKAFYAHHRDRLRINFLHYPEKHRKFEEIDDSWAAVLCVLMVKFALGKKDEETLVGIQSNKIVKALNESPFKAKEAVFPFVKATQRRIFDDIEAHECNFNDETASVGDSQMSGLTQTLESEQSAEVKLHSDNSAKQTSLLKENSSSDIAE